MIWMMAGHMSLMGMTLAFGMGFGSPWVWFGVERVNTASSCSFAFFEVALRTLAKHAKYLRSRRHRTAKQIIIQLGSSYIDNLVYVYLSSTLHLATHLTHCNHPNSAH